jgi:hypothetical protein
MLTETLFTISLSVIGRCSLFPKDIFTVEERAQLGGIKVSLF